MPLIVVCGFPCSGKTRFTRELASFLASHGCGAVEIVNEESEGILKAQCFASSAAEKAARGVIKSAVNHKLNKDNYVIVDSLNYIKGYRYELYCIARSMRTTHCVCWVQAHNSDSNIWNQTRLSEGSDGYESQAIMDELRLRFEAPQEKNRWDNPLFRISNASSPVTAASTSVFGDGEVEPHLPADVTVPSNGSQDAALPPAPPTPPAPQPTKLSSWKSNPKKKNSSSGASVSSAAQSSLSAGGAVSVSGGAVSVSVDQPAPLTGLSISGSVVRLEDVGGMLMSEAFEVVRSHFMSAVAAAPNSSTVPVPHAAAGLLYELDRTTQAVSQSILSHQRDCLEGTPVVFAEFNRTLSVHRPVGVAEMQRLRRQFVKANGNVSFADAVTVGSSFIDYLATQL